MTQDPEEVKKQVIKKSLSSKDKENCCPVAVNVPPGQNVACVIDGGPQAAWVQIMA